MWAARSIADAAVVLFHGIAMTWQLRPGRAGPDRPALDGKWPFGSPLRSTTPPATRRDHDRTRVGDRWVEQFDLRPDDAVEACLLGGAHEPDGTVQAVPVGGS